MLNWHVCVLFGYTILRNLWGMATLQQKIEAELRFRALVDEEGLPHPDHIEYGHGCIRALWTASKLCVIVDIDDPGWDPDIEGLDAGPCGLDAGRPERDAGAFSPLDGWEAA